MYSWLGQNARGEDEWLFSALFFVQTLRPPSETQEWDEKRRLKKKFFHFRTIVKKNLQQKRYRQLFNNLSISDCLSPVTRVYSATNSRQIKSQFNGLDKSKLVWELISINGYWKTVCFRVNYIRWDFFHETFDGRKISSTQTDWTSSQYWWKKHSFKWMMSRKDIHTCTKENWKCGKAVDIWNFFYCVRVTLRRKLTLYPASNVTRLESDCGRSFLESCLHPET